MCLVQTVSAPRSWNPESECVLSPALFSGPWKRRRVGAGLTFVLDRGRPYMCYDALFIFGLFYLFECRFDEVLPFLLFVQKSANSRVGIIDLDTPTPLVKSILKRSAN